MFFSSLLFMVSFSFFKKYFLHSTAKSVSSSDAQHTRKKTQTREDHLNLEFSFQGVYRKKHLDDNQLCLASPDQLHLLFHLPPFPGGNAGVETKVCLLQAQNGEKSGYLVAIDDCLNMVVLVVTEWCGGSVPSKTHVELICVHAANQLNLPSLLPCDQTRQREGGGGSKGDRCLGRNNLLPFLYFRLTIVPS